MLLLEIRNLKGGCEVHWQASGKLRDGELDLLVENPTCDSRAGCGWCSYDLGFELAGVDTARPLQLSLQVQGTCDPAEPRTRITLPLDREPSGILCRGAENAGLAGHLQCDGKRYASCGEDAWWCSGDEPATCGADLTCGALVAGPAQRCLPACTNDADCAADADFLFCDQGVCRLDPTRAF